MEILLLEGRGRTGFPFRSIQYVALREKTGKGTKSEEGVYWDRKERTPCVVTSNSCCPCSFCTVVFYRIQAVNPVIVETLIVIRELRCCVLFFSPSPPPPWNKNGDLVTGLPRGLYTILSPSPLEKKGGAIYMGGERGEFGTSEDETL